MGTIDVFVDRTEQAEPVASRLAAQWQARLQTLHIPRYYRPLRADAALFPQAALSPQAKVLTYCLARYEQEDEVDDGAEPLLTATTPTVVAREALRAGKPPRSRAQIRKVLQHIAAGQETA